MSVEANYLFVEELKERLKAEVVVADMEKIVNAVTDLLGTYRLERIIAEQTGEDVYLKAYLDALRVEGRSEKTIARYEYLIRRMLGETKVLTKDVTTYHIRSFLTREKERGIQDSTINGLRQVYSAYFGWLQRDGLINHNPMSNIGTVKCQKKVRKAFSDVDLERMKEHCKSVRDKAIICFLNATGCRISEMTGLNRADVDLNQMECKVLGKGNKERVVYLDEVTCSVLQAYFEERKDDSEALFVGKFHERLQPGGVRNMLKQVGEAAHVANAHPHKFRRTLATNLIRRGMPIQEVATILGHEKLDTTMRYVVLDKRQVKNAYQKYV